jgi:phage repressor protein C with HTH and peptisase S24 domain
MLKIAIRRVVGDSMSPGLNQDSLIAVLKSKRYKVGDVVGFKLNDQVLIKRVCKINDSLVYVLGDNPNNSLDSRKLGWINQDSIVFKLIFRIK